MTKTLPLSEVKIKLSAIIAGVVRRSDEVIITRNGKPAAVLISADEYDSWRETQEIKRDPELMKEIQKGMDDLNTGRVREVDLNELFGEKAGE